MWFLGNFWCFIDLKKVLIFRFVIFMWFLMFFQYWFFAYFYNFCWFRFKSVIFGSNESGFHGEKMVKMVKIALEIPNTHYYLCYITFCLSILHLRYIEDVWLIHQTWKPGVCYWPISMPNNITKQYQRCIYNSVELWRWSSFTKIVNG